MKLGSFEKIHKITIFSFAIACCLLMGAVLFASTDPFLHGFKITGFQSDGPVQVYNRESLFQYMNGEAEIYISYGFELLYLQSYLNSKTGSLITTESYNMGSPEGAAKIYSEYSGKSASDLEGLGEASWTDDYLVLFRRNRFFCRVMPDPSYDVEVEPTLQEIMELCKSLDSELKTIHSQSF